MWYDYSSGHEEPMLWVGLSFKNKADREHAPLSVSDATKPKSTFSVGVGRVLPYSVSEDYPNVSQYYIERYFSDYSIDAAVAYLRALTGVEGLSREAWEGEVGQRMTTYYEKPCLKSKVFG